jgi:integrase
MPATRKVAMTDRSIRAIRPDGTRRNIWDSLMPGHCVRVSALGKISFYAVRRLAPTDANPVWAYLGAYPVMGLGEARAAAREALNAMIGGSLPKTLAEEKRRQAAAEALEAEASTFAKIAERFDQRYISSELAPASVRHYRHYLSRELIPALGTKQITEIKRRDVVAVISGVAARSGKASATGALAVVRKLLNWALNQDIPGFESNPAGAINTADVVGRSRPRDRLLSDAEVAAIWKAIPETGEPFAAVYRILLLTGLRLNEVAASRWEDLDLEAGTLTISAERSKTDTAMLVPLPPAAIALLASVKRYSGPFIFSTTGGGRPIQGFSHAKERLDAALAGAAIPPFVIHDLRRCVRSGLGRLGVPTHVAEMVLGHAQRGIVKTYDRYDYIDERRAALHRWESHLLSIVAPAPDEGGKVIPLPARARA